MSILTKHVPLVKDQMEFHQRMASRFAENPYRQSLHRQTQAQFEALLSDLESADILLDHKGGTSEEVRNSSNRQSPRRLALTPQDIDGLPPEVLRELSISESDKTEFAILSLLEEADGVLSLDQLIVGLWRQTGEAHKRSTLTSRLYRMSQKDLLFSVPTKKGVYANRLISEDEASRLFGSERLPVLFA